MSGASRAHTCEIGDRNYRRSDDGTRQAIVVDEAIAQCKRRREHTNSSHTTKHAELSKAIALLKVTQSECKFNAARKSAASVFLRLQWVGVALSGVAGIMRIHNSMH